MVIDVPDLWQEYAKMIADPTRCDPSGIVPERPTMEQTERRLAGQRTTPTADGRTTIKEWQALKEGYGICAVTPARHRPR